MDRIFPPFFSPFLPLYDRKYLSSLYSLPLEHLLQSKSLLPLTAPPRKRKWVRKDVFLLSFSIPEVLLPFKETRGTFDRSPSTVRRGVSWNPRAVTPEPTDPLPPQMSPPI